MSDNDPTDTPGRPGPVRPRRPQLGAMRGGRVPGLPPTNQPPPLPPTPPGTPAPTQTPSQAPTGGSAPAPTTATAPAPTPQAPATAAPPPFNPGVVGNPATRPAPRAQMGVRNAPPPMPPAPPVSVPVRPVVPANQQLGADRQGKLSAKNMDKLPPDQRQWSDNVLKALKLKSKGSQARVLAGAVATASQIGQTGGADAVQAGQLLARITAAGDPPWRDTRKAMAAADAAMQLDLLSIPTGQRQLKPLGSGGGVNKAFTVERLDADGQMRPAFLCKPASPPGDFGDKVEGIPDGGEVIREAVAGRAAQTFAAMTGIDIGMPESHVVQLSAATVPGSQPGDPDVTCSIQEWGPGLKPVKTLSMQARASFNPAQVAALAVFDLMTLNTDRHSENIMTDGQGSMLPIDHGASFPQGPAGLMRITDTVSAPHNVLLRLPSAFEPMPPAMVKSLKAMKSSDYRDGLAKDRDDVAAVHPSMDTMIDDQALDWAGKAARFVKLAAAFNPPLPAGSMQVAFGGAAYQLMEAPDFDTAANAVIARAAANVDVVKAVCTADDAEYAELARKVAALGWRVHERGSTPVTGGVSDPVTMLSIIESNRRYPAGVGDDNRADTDKTERQALFNATPPPATMKARLLTLRKDLISQYIALMPAAQRAPRTAALNALAGTPDQQMAASTALMTECRDAAVAEQIGRLNAKVLAGATANDYRVVNAREAANRNDPISMNININLLQ